MQEQLSRWRSGVGSEIQFWSDLLRHKGGAWAEEFRSSLNPTRPIDPELGQIIARLGKSEISILDVGSGPLTTLGQLWPDVRISLTTADPLAAAYSRILDAPLAGIWLLGLPLARRIRSKAPLARVNLNALSKRRRQLNRC